jgi:26S proteasome regulatory subunit T4
MFAIRKEADFVVQDDFMKAARKIKEAKSLESKLDYQKI